MEEKEPLLVLNSAETGVGKGRNRIWLCLICFLVSTFIIKRSVQSNPRKLIYSKNNQTHSVYDMIETTKESNGARMVMNGTVFKGLCTDQSIKPSDRLCTPPLHSHPFQEETFEVVEGFFEYILENTTGIITAGQKILIPKGKVHSFSVPKDQELKLIISFFPGMKMEEFFEQNVGMRKDSENIGSFFGFIEGALHMKRYENNELIVNRPSTFVNFICQFFGSLIGVKDFIPEYNQLNK